MDNFTMLEKDIINTALFRHFDKAREHWRKSDEGAKKIEEQLCNIDELHNSIFRKLEVHTEG